MYAIHHQVSPPLDKRSRRKDNELLVIVFPGRPILFSGALVCLGVLAWQALAGGWRQARRSRTASQKMETAAQMSCGWLSLLVALTCFWQRRWARPVRKAWAASFITAAGLSGIAWGPPMPRVGVILASLAACAALAIHRILSLPLTEGGPSTYAHREVR